MGNDITASFNNTFGSNITYVANAYSRNENEWIWVCFHTEKLSVESINLAVNKEDGASIEANLAKSTNHAWVRVPYRDVHKKRRNTCWEYLTVISHNGKVLIAHNYEIEANRSFIVTKQGGLKTQKYGGDVWEDERGNNHYPK